MQTSRLSELKKSIFVEVFGDKGPEYFFEARFLPRWLPLFLGASLGILSAILIVDGSLHFVIPLVFLIPAIIIFNKYPFAAIMLWILLFPYFVREPSAAGRFIYWILHRAMIPGTLGIVLLSHWLGVRKREMVKFGRAELVMLLFIILAVVNILLLNNDPRQTLIRFYDRLFVPLCMYWLVRTIAPTTDELKQLLWVAFITVMAQSIIGLLSWFAPQVLPPQWLGLEGVRTVGTFGNAAVYTTTLIFLSLFLFQYAMNFESRLIRNLFFIAFGLAYFCVFFSFSRGSWLGGTLVLLGLLFIHPGVVLRLTTIVLILAFILGNSILAQQVAWAVERLNDENTANSRIVQNATSLKMIQEKPFFGWGYDNYKRFSRQFVSRVGDIAVGDSSTSHNTYLTVIVEMGLVGLFLYMFPVSWWLLLTLKVYRRLPKTGFLSWPLLVMLWLLLLDHFTVSNFMPMIQSNLFGTTVWWMALGFIASMVYPYLEPGDIGAPTWAHRPVEQAV